MWDISSDRPTQLVQLKGHNFGVACVVSDDPKMVTFNVLISTLETLASYNVCSHVHVHGGTYGGGFLWDWNYVPTELYCNSRNSIIVPYLFTTSREYHYTITALMFHCTLVTSFYSIKVCISHLP